MTEDEIIKQRIANLISVRQLIIGILTVLTGGVCGLFFTHIDILKSILAIMGICGIVILLKEFKNTNREIRSYLYKKRR